MLTAFTVANHTTHTLSLSLSGLPHGEEAEKEARRPSVGDAQSMPVLARPMRPLTHWLNVGPSMSPAMPLRMPFGSQRKGNGFSMEVFQDWWCVTWDSGIPIVRRLVAKREFTTPCEMNEPSVPSDTFHADPPAPSGENLLKRGSGSLRHEESGAPFIETGISIKQLQAPPW